MSQPLSFVLDGVPVTVEVDPKTASLAVLRERLGVHGCKAGCAPQGLCGCCTVLIEGKPRLTCTLPVKSLAGKTVTTLDGLPEADRALLADSFVRAGATQCGYCTPGIALSAWALLQAEATPSPEAITRALNQHLCRCTGYTAIAMAIGAAAAVRRGEACPLPALDRPEGAAIVLGGRPYTDDLERPGMLHGALVLAPAAAGRIETIDLDAARAIPGVIAVALHAPGDRVAHAGDVVAVVAAGDPATAREAAAAVEVEIAADAADATVTEAAGGDGSVELVPRVDAVLARARRVDGDVDAAFASCAFTVEERFELAPTDPVFLEPEAALAVPVRDAAGGAGLVVYSPGHDASAEARALTAALGMPVRVVLVPSGGSYGGKEALPVPLAAARLAAAAGRPVRVAVGLEDGMRLHPRRPGATVRARLGCDAEGRRLVVALQVRFAGGAACGGADRIVGQALGAVAYSTAALAVDAWVERTGGAPTGPIRGAGGIAVTFAIERCLDHLAAAAGLDPFVLRARNLDGDGAAVLAALADPWAAEAGPRGLALGRVDGSGGARVVLTVAGPDSVEVQCNVPELGQGRDEALLAALVAVTGLPGDVFEIAWADSSVVGDGAPATSPVGDAARCAGALLALAGGSLADRVGERFVGEDPERAAPGWAANLAVLDATGAVRTVWTSVAMGAAQPPRLVANLAEGASHMGVGVALSEEIVETNGLPDGRLRLLGVLKPKGSPALVAVPVAREGGPREIAEVAILGVPGAIANAVAAGDGARRSALPMKDSLAARAVGVRPPRPPAGSAGVASGG
jgi:xanthine dehydrogenase molybdenum-binding subunit